MEGGIWGSDSSDYVCLTFALMWVFKNICPGLLTHCPHLPSPESPALQPTASSHPGTENTFQNFIWEESTGRCVHTPSHLRASVPP